MKTFPVFRLQFHGRRRTILPDPCAFCGAGPACRVPVALGSRVCHGPLSVSRGLCERRAPVPTPSGPTRPSGVLPRAPVPRPMRINGAPQGSGPEATTSPDLPGQVIGAVGQHRVRTSADPTKGSRVAGAGVEPHRPSLHVVRTLPIQSRDNISHPAAALSGPKDE